MNPFASIGVGGDDDDDDDITVLVLAEESQSKAKENLINPSNEFIQKLMDRCRTLEQVNARLQVEARAQQQQYEICLDRVATQVVQALLSQKIAVETEVSDALEGMDIHQEERMSEVSSDTEKDLLKEDHKEESTLTPEEDDEVDSESLPSVPAREPLPSTSSTPPSNDMRQALANLTVLMESIRKQGEEREAKLEMHIARLSASRGSHKRPRVQDLPTCSETNP
ncbi:nck-associated protein 5-like [Palaemon carinicauda]|uniref:nck-associated protein 5-like n=1 Tax=Palaemon carinicauda TaxID=392227 RepID=UPI0035B6AA8B